MTERPTIYEVDNPAYKKPKKNESYSPQPGSIQKTNLPPQKSLAEQMKDREQWWAEYERIYEKDKEEKVKSYLKKYTLAEQLKKG